MSTGDSLSVQCPACHGTGLNVWELVCKVCDSTGQVTKLRKAQWLENRRLATAEALKMQPPLFI